MGGTIIEEEKMNFPSSCIAKLSQEAIDCMIAGCKLSVVNSKILARRVIRIKNPLLSRIFSNLASHAIDALESWISGVERDPNIVDKVYTKVDIRSTRELTKAVLPVIVKKL